MKVVLSRKGFDAQYGRVPNPILPDGRLVSLPIGDKESVVSYEDLHPWGLSVGDLVRDLTRGNTRPNHLAHLDPDLEPSTLPRSNDWRPLFGQAGAALGHLKAQRVEVGDLFLFFGWFREVFQVGDTWTFRPGTIPRHVVWGWMHIGAFYEVKDLPDAVRKYAHRHPHLQRSVGPSNGLYIASDGFRVGSCRVAGAGVFPSESPARRLSAEGQRLRSLWRLPKWMHPESGSTCLSYHGDPDRWSPENPDSCLLQTVGKGQEFVLTTHDQASLKIWLSKIFTEVQRG